MDVQAWARADGLVENNVQVFIKIIIWESDACEIENLQVVIMNFNLFGSLWKI